MATPEVRLGNEAEAIIRRVTDLAGGHSEANLWYVGFPIPAFGGKTAKELVGEGKADAVQEYLNGVDAGSFQ